MGGCDCRRTCSNILFNILSDDIVLCVCVINMFDGDLMMSVVGGWWGIWYSIDIIIYLAKRV